MPIAAYAIMEPGLCMRIRSGFKVDLVDIIYRVFRILERMCGAIRVKLI